MVTTDSRVSRERVTSAISEYTPPVVVRGIKAVRSSFLLFVALVGVGSVLIGMYLRLGILAGMFGIWGISAIFAAGVAYVVLSLLQ